MWVLTLYGKEYHLSSNHRGKYTLGRNQCDFLLQEPYISKHHLSFQITGDQIEFDVIGRAHTYIGEELFRVTGESDLSTKRNKEAKVKIGKFGRKNNKADEFITFSFKFIEFILPESIRAEIGSCADLMDITFSTVLEHITHYISPQLGLRSVSSEFLYAVLKPEVKILKHDFIQSLKGQVKELKRSTSFQQDWAQLLKLAIHHEYACLDFKTLCIFFQSSDLCLLYETKTDVSQSVSELLRQCKSTVTSLLITDHFKIRSLAEKGCGILALDIPESKLGFLSEYGASTISNEKLIQFILAEDRSILRSVIKPLKESNAANTISSEPGSKVKDSSAPHISSRRRGASRYSQKVNTFDMIFGLDDEKEKNEEEKHSEAIPEEPVLEESIVVEESTEPPKLSSRRQRFKNLQNSLKKDEGFLLFDDAEKNDDDEEEEEEGTSERQAEAEPVDPLPKLSSRRQRLQNLQNLSKEDKGFLVFDDAEKEDAIDTRERINENNVIATDKPKDNQKGLEVGLDDIPLPKVIGKKRSATPPSPERLSPQPSNIIKGDAFLRLQEKIKLKDEEEEERLRRIKLESRGSSSKRGHGNEAKPVNHPADNSKLIGILQQAKKSKIEEIKVHELDASQEMDDISAFNKVIKDKIEVVGITVTRAEKSTVAEVSQSSKWAGLNNFKKFRPINRKISEVERNNRTRRVPGPENRIKLIEYDENSNYLASTDVQMLDRNIRVDLDEEANLTQFDSDFNNLKITRKRQKDGAIPEARHVVQKKPKKLEGLFVPESQSQDVGSDNGEEDLSSNTMSLNGASIARKKPRLDRPETPDNTISFSEDFNDNSKDDGDLGMPKFISRRKR